MTKTLFLLFCAATLAAQPVFQKKMDGIHTAEGLALLPDGGWVLVGTRGNCIQIVRFDAAGSVLWMRQACPADPAADMTIRSLHLVADAAMPGAFLLLFRKGAFFSSPTNLLYLMKFDAVGNLLWENQLRPEKRYGAFSPGSQLATTPSGAAWAVHGMGFTDLLPDFNQALVFKISASGQMVLRRFFLTDEPATANGIAIGSENEAYVYGGLGTAIVDGFLLKINELGDTIWAKRYAGISFLRNGGLFPNGDLLLMAEHEQAFALARVRPDGAVAWTKKIVDTVSLFHCAIAADGGVLLVGRRPNAPSFLFKISAATGATEWAKTYEECTRYHITALQSTLDGGFVFAQSTTSGSPRTRFLKADALGQISPECPFWEVPLPNLEAISVAVSPIRFSWSGTLLQDLEHVFKLSEASIEVKDCCPAEYPDAKFSLPDSVCANSSFDLVSMGNPCADEWHWQAPGAMPDEAHSPVFQNIIYNTEGDFPITLTETIGVCSDTFIASVHSVAALDARLFGFSDTLLCPDTPFVAQPNLTGFEAWLWGDGSSDPVRFFDPPTAGTFRIAAQKGLCTVADSFKITIGNCGSTRVFAPNAFSPNDDGQNDVWEIFWQRGVTPLGCQVFDRWGNLCYAVAPGETPRWDGTVSGRPMPTGVYVWQFRLQNVEGREENLSGEVLLVR